MSISESRIPILFLLYEFLFANYLSLSFLYLLPLRFTFRKIVWNCFLFDCYLPWKSSRKSHPRTGEKRSVVFDCLGCRSSAFSQQPAPWSFNVAPYPFLKTLSVVGLVAMRIESWIAYPATALCCVVWSWERKRKIELFKSYQNVVFAPLPKDSSYFLYFGLELWYQIWIYEHLYPNVLV